MTDKKFMVAKTRVDLRWQALFSIIAPLDIWAFYRIQKLRRALLLIAVPGIAIWIVIPGLLFGAAYYAVSEEEYPEIPDIPFLHTAIMVGFMAWSIYLIVRWSKIWNVKFQ